MSQPTQWYGPGPYSRYHMKCLACGRLWWSQPRTVAPKRCPEEGCRRSQVSILGKSM